MSELRIEPAALEDLPLMAELLADLFGHGADFRPDQAKQLRGLRLILEQPNRGRIFVLRNNERIIAMVNLLFTISTAEGGPVIILEDFVVHATHRGQGYGGKLLQYVIDFAKKKKFLRISLIADRAESRVPAFWRRHGFVESEMVTMRLRFEPQAVGTA